MDNKEEFLNENKYQKTSKNLFYVGIGIIIFGVAISIIILIPKLTFGSKSNKKELEQQLSQLKPGLEKRYAELKAQGVRESWDYKDKEGYEMHLIDEALDPTLDKCEDSSTYSDHDTTREYCKVKAQLYELDSPMRSGGILFDIFPALMVLMPCLGFGGVLILTSKRRNIMAYSLQQTMPVAQEGIEKMAPTLGKAGASISKEMAPVYGEIAKEISKGIREGRENQVKCKYCGELIDKDATFCESCGKKL